MERLVSEVEKLRYGNSDHAELLYQSAKMYSVNYFQRRYSVDLVGLKFRVQFSAFETLDKIWPANKAKLLAIARTMHEDYLLSKPKPQLVPPTLPKPRVVYVEKNNKEEVDSLLNTVDTLQSELAEIKEKEMARAASKFKTKRDILFWTLLIIPSFILWTFPSVVNWQWFEVHPKKIAILISMQALIMSRL